MGPVREQMLAENRDIKPERKLLSDFERDGVLVSSSAPSHRLFCVLPAWWPIDVLRELVDLYGEELEISEVEEVLESKMERCFERIVMEFAEKRAAADMAGDTIQSQTVKGILNRSYGSSIQRSDLHTNLQILMEGAMASKQEKPNYLQSHPVGPAEDEQLYETEMSRLKRPFRQPFLIGVSY